MSDRVKMVAAWGERVFYETRIAFDTAFALIFLMAACIVVPFVVAAIAAYIALAVTRCEWSVLVLFPALYGTMWLMCHALGIKMDA